MSVAQSRFVAFWASYETRARIWYRLFVGSAILLGLSLVTTIRALNHPREVIRIGCDGIPAVVSLTDAYSEPNDTEIQAFSRRFAEVYARADSFSVANDFAFCQRYMQPKLREAFKREARGDAGHPGVIAVIESLKRRTQIDPRTLKVDIDKRSYPWVVRVEGVRQLVGLGQDAGQAFSLEMELVRANRSEILEGLLVWSIRSRNDPVTGGLTKGE